MTPVLVFFGIAAVIGIVIATIVRLRLRAASQQPDVSEEQLCELRKANRISSTAVVASVAGLVVVAVVLVVL